MNRLLSFTMKQYHDLLKLVLEKGTWTSNRTGVKTKSYFGAQARFPLENTFPLLTTKKVHLRSIIYELLWFLRGDTNTRYLKDTKVTSGTSGPMLMEISAESMAPSGVTGARLKVNQSIRLITSLNRSKRTPLAAA